MLSILKELNDNYSQLALVVIALISFIGAYHELVLKVRPYVVPEITVDKNENGNWYFNIILVNKGEKPGIARVKNALLQIGDERYATPFELEFVLAPDERAKLLPIGHINELGRNNIKTNKYLNNNVQIILEIESKALGDKEFKYTTTEQYVVDVTGENPQIRLVKESLN